MSNAGKRYFIQAATGFLITDVVAIENPKGTENGKYPVEKTIAKKKMERMGINNYQHEKHKKTCLILCHHREEKCRIEWQCLLR
jgi:hypothetical protein